MTKLLTENTKTIKSDKANNTYKTYIMHLQPADLSGFDVCKHRSPGCTFACLNTAGRGIFDNVQAARKYRTELMFNEPQLFFDKLVDEISKLRNKAFKNNQRLAVRLNGTSDIPFERHKYIQNIFPLFDDVQFFDYTAWPYDKRPAENLPVNYDLTFSRKEDNDNEVAKNLLSGRRIAAVFDYMPGPEFDNNLPVVNGDLDDKRFLDPNPSIVALVQKGRARQDNSGFVIRKDKNQKLWKDLI